MHGTWAIYKKELKSYFSHPIAYVLIAAFLGVAGYFLVRFLVRFKYWMPLNAIRPFSSIGMKQKLVRPRSAAS